MLYDKHHASRQISQIHVSHLNLCNTLLYVVLHCEHSTLASVSFAILEYYLKVQLVIFNSQGKLYTVLSCDITNPRVQETTILSRRITISQILCKHIQQHLTPDLLGKQKQFICQISHFSLHIFNYIFTQTLMSR